MHKALVWVLQILAFLAFLLVWAAISYYVWIVSVIILAAFGVSNDSAREVSAVLVRAVPICVFVVWMMRRLGLGKTGKVKTARAEIEDDKPP